MTFDLGALLRRKRAAQARLEDPVLVEAFATVRTKMLTAIERSKVHDIEEREAAYAMLRALDAVKGELAAMVRDHDFALRRVGDQ